MSTALTGTAIGPVGQPRQPKIRSHHMTLVRSIFLALAVMLPTTWTVAQAADPAPPAGEAPADAKKEKKAKKGAKKEGAEGEKKPEGDKAAK
jgi:hypothetical protein